MKHKHKYQLLEKRNKMEDGWSEWGFIFVCECGESKWVKGK